MTNHNIRLARADEFEQVRLFYFDMIDALEHEKYGPGWKKDIYPSPDELHEAIDCGELWLYELEGRYAAVMILNSRRGDGYERLEKESGIKGDDALLIHALGVGFDFQRRGIATEMVRFTIEYARNKCCKALRLDVLSGNLPAEQIYPALGFEHKYTVNMFYEDTGWADYKIYQLLL